MDWIKLHEQNPEFEKPVLVAMEGQVLIARLIQKRISSDVITFDFYQHAHGFETLWITPTHWMPLPDPPTAK